MNSEAQEVVNAQVERRLTVLENDMKEVKETVTDIRVDQKYLIKTLNKVNDRWEEFDQMQRKNKNELIMKFLGCIIAGIAGYILAALNLSK
jgi:septal ring factor EnvC (AmiA/AmiB activator)